MWPDYLHKCSRNRDSMYILKYDSLVKVSVISKGLHWLHKANLQSLKLSDNNKSQIRSISL